MKGKEKKRRWRRRKGDGKGEEGERRKEKRRGRQEEKRGRKEKRREKKGGRRRIRNRESSARDSPPSPGAFPSQKLGNNMTLIKGRLGKNTTHIGRDPEKLIQKLQSNPNKDS